MCVPQVKKKILPEVSWRPLHVDSGDLERDGLQLSQQVQVHEVLLAKDASTLSLAIDEGGLDDQLDLRHALEVDGAVLHVVDFTAVAQLESTARFSN